MKIPKVANKDLVNVTDLSTDEVLSLFKFAKKLKKETRLGKHHKLLEGKTLGMIFEKSSTRTRVSFEVGTYQLGGQALFLSRDDIQLGRGETTSDTARVLSRYVDAIMIRAYSHNTVIELSEYADVPVINGLSDLYHPCQGLTDLFTIYEREKKLPNTKIAYVGDGNNVAHSLLLTAALTGIDIAVASPRGYSPSKDVVERAFNLSTETDSQVNVTTDINLAVDGANYIYTDVWVSMGQEKQAAKRRKALSKYKITRKVLDKCAPDCKVMHCLPAHRGEEIDEDVLESDQSIVFEQAENRMHLQKALLCSLLGSE